MSEGRGDELSLFSCTVSVVLGQLGSLLCMHEAFTVIPYTLDHSLLNVKLFISVGMLYLWL